jgi:ElaB/YqjD/DUF883 family membrane-anchored ribosome-binding protein
MPKLEAMQAKSAISAAAGSLRDVIDSAEDILENVSDQKGRAAEQLRDNLSEAVANARQRLRNLDLPETVSKAYDDGVDYVQRNPWRALAIGGIAVLAAALLFRAASED